jgi:hypothetical protein
MGLRINKNFKISPSVDDILFFESDEEFTDFCVASFAEIKESENGDIYVVGDYSDEYKKCLEQGKMFIIKDEDSQVYKRQCVTKRVPVFNNGDCVTAREDYPVQLSVKNLEEYDESLWEKAL